MKSFALLLLRWVALASFAVWFGGFTFYSAVVIPVLHDELGGLGQGGITGRVSDTLNVTGVATVAAWWVLVGFERAGGERWARRLRVVLLAVTTAILIGLIALHPVLDERFEVGSMRSFHRLHQVYLIASTVQWGANLALLAVTVWVWREGPGTCRDRGLMTND
jgi:hypothetical protein